MSIEGFEDKDVSDVTLLTSYPSNLIHEKTVNEEEISVFAAKPGTKSLEFKLPTKKTMELNSGEKIMYVADVPSISFSFAIAPDTIAENAVAVIAQTVEPKNNKFNLVLILAFVSLITSGLVIFQGYKRFSIKKVNLAKLRRGPIFW